jgi:hypothetical protein
MIQEFSPFFKAFVKGRQSKAGTAHNNRTFVCLLRSTGFLRPCFFHLNEYLKSSISKYANGKSRF